MNRRTFMKSTGGVVLANQAGSSLEAASRSLRSTNAPLRVVAFFDASFPVIAGITLTEEEIRSACKGCSVTFADATGLASSIDAAKPHILVTAHGSAFPVAAFPAILEYLRSGGNWINVGGVPLHVPVAGSVGAWQVESAQTAYHKRIGITQSYPVTTSTVKQYVGAGPYESAEDFPDECAFEEIFALSMRLTDSKEFPHEDGSEGFREASLHPFVHGLDADGIAVAAPVVVVDRLYETFRGGRWVFANFRGRMTDVGLRGLVHIASFGAIEIMARPSLAAYLDDECPVINVSIRRPAGAPESYLRKDPLVQIFSEAGRSIFKQRLPLHAQGQILTASIDVPQRTGSGLSTGLYTVVFTAAFKHPVTSQSEDVTYSTGFWFYSPSMLAGGDRLTMDAHHFYRNAQPFPVTGTTYMSSESHRRFLLEPNPFLWNTDFGAMAAAGMNMMRTGIWTGWKQYMYDSGLRNDAALRGMDAFLLTARKHGIIVVFTFFAFLPEDWGSENPYLDPRAVRMQKEFISLFSNRYGAMNDIVWDLINEPSFCSAKALWTTRPNYDRHEHAAWNTWHHDKSGSFEHSQQARSRIERYRTPNGGEHELPTLADFNDANIFDDASPITASDYRRFAQDMFIRWIREMTEAIRSNGNAYQLVTVGQDEGGTYERPAQLLFAGAVDFTSIHNWWFNDDLVWDIVMTKSPRKPSLVEETGVMFYEKIDGSAWRTETEVRNLLFRKLAVATAGSAGYIQWNWNVNPYIRSDNEAAIGLFRIDGSAKPEYDVFARFSSFIQSHRNVFRAKQDCEITIVVPHSNLFSVRNQATEATRRAVRTLFHECGLVADAVSEYRPGDFPTATRLFILPSPRVISTPAWTALLESVHQGAVLLVTGPIESDEHWLPADRLSALNIRYAARPVMNEEYCVINGKEYWLAFRGEKVQRIEKAVLASNEAPSVHRIEHGAGSILWCPLPVELSDRPEALTALYSHAAGLAACRPLFSRPEKSSAVIILPSVYKDAVLYACISESDRDLEAIFTHMETGTTFVERIPAQQGVLLIIDRKNGALLARFTPEDDSSRGKQHASP